MNEKVLYPRSKRPEKDRSHLKWVVHYHNLCYDGGGSGSWTQYYHTKMGARISAFLNYHVFSWGGGTVTLKNNWEGTP